MNRHLQSNRPTILVLVVLICILLIPSCQNSPGALKEKEGELNTILHKDYGDNIVVTNLKISGSSLELDLTDEFSNYPGSTQFKVFSEIINNYVSKNKYIPEQIEIHAQTQLFEYHFHTIENMTKLDVSRFGEARIYKRYDEDSIALETLALNTDFMTKIDPPAENSQPLDRTSSSLEKSNKTSVDRVSIYNYIEARYSYYDKLEGQYAGDKYTNTIFNEAANNFGVTIDFVDSVWSGGNLANIKVPDAIHLSFPSGKQYKIWCGSRPDDYQNLIKLIKDNNLVEIEKGYISGDYFFIRSEDWVTLIKEQVMSNENSYSVNSGPYAKKTCYTSSLLE